ncbi:hypothetical protein C8Q70DRAFT_1024959 [Cubamyces menziesii]|nr:hypothetical protein C8Q70DRAFT_1024959 [Cubamyces menziesii]
MSLCVLWCYALRGLLVRERAGVVCKMRSCGGLLVGFGPRREFRCIVRPRMVAVADLCAGLPIRAHNPFPILRVPSRALSLVYAADNSLIEASCSVVSINPWRNGRLMTPP